MRICACGHTRAEHTRQSAQAVLRANEGIATENVPRDNPPTDAGFTVTQASTSGRVDDEHSIEPKHTRDTEASAEKSVRTINTMAERQMATVGGNVLRQEDRERLDVQQEADDEVQANLHEGEDPAPCDICPDCNDWRPEQETIAPADDQTNAAFLPNPDPDRQKTDVQIQNERLQAQGEEQPVFDEEPEPVADDNIVNHPEDEPSDEPEAPEAKDSDGGTGEGPNGPKPEDEDEDVTKDDLMERAKALDIQGRSSMNKEELAKAVADAEASS